MPNLAGRFAKAFALHLVNSLAGRSSLENPSTPLSFPAEWLLDIFTGGRTDSGQRVSEMMALQVSTVYACVMRVATSVATLPLNVYEHTSTVGDKRSGKRLATDHDLFDLVHYEPNPEMTSRTFRLALQAHALLWGNAYAEIQRDKTNRPVALWPRNPARTRPVRKNNVLSYVTSEGIEEVTDLNGGGGLRGNERPIAADDMLHVPGLTLDGRLGSSVVQLSRQNIGLALAAEKFGNKLFANYGRPGGLLEHPAVLSNDARDRIKKSWAEAQGGENIHTVPLLEEGLKWVDVANKPNEAQFLETRQFQRAEICSIFGVPPHMIGDPDKQNRANTEQLGLEFTTFTMQPWLVAWEQEFKRKLFHNLGRNANKFFVAFDTRRLMMPDATSRKGFYIAGKQWGFLSTNDIREMENLNPVDDPDADALWIPLNMAKAGAQSNPDEDDDLAARQFRGFSRVFRDAFGRIVRRDEADSEAFRMAFLPVLLSVADLICQRSEVEEQLRDGEQIEYLDFVRQYIEGMRSRLPQWKTANGEADIVADQELGRAAGALKVQIYRALEEKKRQREAE
jgi:HK97 family phage portal protein